MNVDRPGEGTPFGTVNGRYVLEEIVGSGGMGVVYRGRDQVLDRAVAVKMIRQELAGDEFVRRFEREAAILGRLRSPHIVVVYDYGRHDDKFFLVTDYLADGDLDEWLAQCGPMPPETAVRLVAQLAEGLADAHAHGVVHRDVKPANVLLWRRGEELRPVLADFGIAVAADLSMTAPGAVIGSPLYMAPERHLGMPATIASDIYSMGCLLYTTLTGSPPYWGTEFQAANAHLNEPVPRLPPELDHAAALDEVVATCMDKQPERRFGSADVLAAKLGDLARGFEADRNAEERRPGRGRSGAETTVMTTPAEPGSPGPVPPWRRWRPIAALAVAGALGVTALAWWLQPNADPDPEPSAADPSPTNTTGPPPAPGRVNGKASSADLGVRIRVDLPEAPPDVEYVVERQRQGWETTRPAFMVSTNQGGERACAKVRLVAASEGGRTAGPATEICNRAKPRRMALTYLPGVPCEFDEPEYSGLQCGYFNLAVWGFRPDRQLLVTTIVDDAPSASRAGSIPTNGTGKGLLGAHGLPGGGYVPGGLRIWSGARTVTIGVDGQVQTFDLVALRAQAS